MNGAQQREWARVLAAVVEPRPDGDRQEVLTAAVGLGLDVAPAVVGCSVTEACDSGGRTPVWATDVALQLDLAQYAEDTGPCLDAARDGRQYRVRVAGAQDRYPAFTGAAERHGVLSSLSLPRIGAPRPSALNLYAAGEAVFDADRPRQVADLLARCVTALLDRRPAGDGVPPGAVAAARRRGDRVRRALDALAAREGLDRQEALDELLRRARLEGRSIHALAADLAPARGAS